MKDLNAQSCSTVMPDGPETPDDSQDKYRAFWYVLYMIPLLILCAKISDIGC
jgi:hypothetical protein